MYCNSHVSAMWISCLLPVCALFSSIQSAAVPGDLAWARMVAKADAPTGVAGESGLAMLPDGSMVFLVMYAGKAMAAPGQADELEFDNQHFECQCTCMSLLLCRLDASGDLVWAASDGPALTSARMSVCSDGSVIVAGRMEGAMTFGDGESNETYLPGHGNCGSEPPWVFYDVFVAKYYPDGTLAWAKQAGGSGSGEAAWGVSAFPDGSCVVGGDLHNVNGDPAVFGAGEINETSLPGSGGFLAKYGEEGNLVWAISLLSEFSFVRDVQAFADGSCVVTGITPTEVPALVTAKYDASGVLAWSSNSGSGEISERWHRVCVTPDGSSVMAGTFSEWLRLDQESENEILLSSAGNDDAFLAKYSVGGALLWAKSLGGPSDDAATDVIVTPDGSVLLTGYFLGPPGSVTTMTFGVGEANEVTLIGTMGYNMYLAEFKPDGTLDWARTVTAVAPDADAPPGAIPNFIASRSSESCVTIARAQCPVVFGPGEPGQTTIGMNDTWHSILLAQFDVADEAFPEQGAIVASVADGFIDAGSRLVLTAPAGFENYDWRKDGVAVVDEPPRLVGQGTNVLTFDPVLESDAGTYVCVYDNGEAKLLVQTAPYVLEVLPEGAVPVAGLVEIALATVILAAAGVVCLRHAKHSCAR